MTAPMGSSQEIKLAENLKKIMAEKKLTVTNTAKEVRMNKSTLHGYCNGVVPRNLLQLRNLAEFLDISFAELIFGKCQEPISHSTENKIEGQYLVVISHFNGTDKNEKR